MYEDTLKHLEILLKKTLNLKSFTLVTTPYQTTMIDANYWQSLIITSLPHLEVFNFHFTIVFRERYEHILNRFQQF
jgi:hypothetical protein